MPFLGHESPAKRSLTGGSQNVDDEDDYDDGNRNIILSLIGQLRPGSDLSRITLPTFILERKTMLERITNLLQHPNMLVEATNTEDPQQRFVEVVRWYMSGWHIAPKAVKKPLNPVLGEYFTCYWDLPDGNRAYYVSEQTSHHAPKSSYFYAYPARKIRADGVVIPKSKFLGNSAASMMEGVAYLQLGEHAGRDGKPETYELTQPNIYARNVLVGSLKLEIGDKALVACPALDMKCILEFKVKGYISGTYNEIKGTILHKDKPLYELTGKWNEIVYIKSLTEPKAKKVVFFDTTSDRVYKPQVRPLGEQGAMESRRLWEKVIIALGERNHKVATDEKFSIEDHQRQLQKARQDGTEPPFQPKLFNPIDGPLEFLICVDENLRHAQSPAEVEHILQSIVPILPGAKFPDNFDAPAPQKGKVRNQEDYSQRQRQGQQDYDAQTDQLQQDGPQQGGPQQGGPQQGGPQQGGAPPPGGPGAGAAAGAAGAGAAGAGAAGAGGAQGPPTHDGGDVFHDAPQSPVA